MIKLIAKPGNRTVFVKISNMDSIVKKSIHDALFEIGKSHVRSATTLLNKRKSGRIYLINGKFHQASAPGEAPARLSGDLVRNLDYTVRGHTEMEFGDKTQQGKAPYGKMLEDGTEKMEARPHISTTVQDQSKDTEISFRDSLKKELR